VYNRSYLNSIAEKYTENKRCQENIADWYRAVEEFKEKVPALGRGVAKRIQTEMRDTPEFREAFGSFHRQCQAAIAPNLAAAQVSDGKKNTRDPQTKYF